MVQFPALSNGILQGLRTVSYLEILHAKFYDSLPSPYATLLQKNTSTFENFIFSNGNYTNQNDSLITHSQNFQHAGWGILRSAHEIDDRQKLMVFMDYGPYGGNSHGHADRFNIIVYSNFDEDIKELCGDTGVLKNKNNKKLGYYSALHNKYITSTLAHNTILINNNRQADPSRNFKGKCQINLPLYGGGKNLATEAEYANKKSSNILFDPDNSDSLQYISASSGYNACYGPDFNVRRTIAMIADQYLVDIVNIEKKPEATIKFIDCVIRGPNTFVSTNQQMTQADNWDWEREKFAISYQNDSYNYLYNIDTTKSDVSELWQSQWTKSASGSDTLLQIYGMNTGNQRMITAFSPDSSDRYQLHPREIKANLIIRKYSLSDDWSPEFLSVIKPAGKVSLKEVAVKDSFLVIKNKNQKEYRFDFKNLKLRE
jgi:hypothetical protein